MRNVEIAAPHSGNRAAALTGRQRVRARRVIKAGRVNGKIGRCGCVVPQIIAGRKSRAFDRGEVVERGQMDVRGGVQDGWILQQSRREAGVGSDGRRDRCERLLLLALRLEARQKICEQRRAPGLRRIARGDIRRVEWRQFRIRREKRIDGLMVCGCQIDEGGTQVIVVAVRCDRGIDRRLGRRIQDSGKGDLLAQIAQVAQGGVDDRLRQSP